MKHKIQKDDLVLLLGAGASAEAKIPVTFQMITDIEKLLDTDEDWMKFKGLYSYIKKSVEITKKGNLNIEDLVNTLDELMLLMQREHPLFPFIESWVELMISVQYEFKIVEDFKYQITNRLKRWVIPQNFHGASYYKELVSLQQQFQQPLRIFTLNYDKCVEEICNDVTIERGFGDESKEQNYWDWKKFTDLGEESNADIYLYKLHGSIDWKREDEKLIACDTHHISHNEMQIIFGTRYKLQSYDPYLFCTYEFRDYTLRAKVIVICGYGFGDDHINQIIGQAINSNPKISLLVNMYSDEENKDWLAKKLSLKREPKVNIIYGNASDFFKNQLNINFLDNLVNEEGDEYDELME